MEHFDPADTLRAGRAAPRHPLASSCRPCSSGCSGSGPRCGRFDLSQPALRHPRRRAVPGAGEGADDRVVRARSSTSTTPAPRATASCTARRRTGWPTRARSAGRWSAWSTSSTTTGTSCRPARTAPSTSRARCDFEYHNDPEKTESSRDPQGRGWTTLGDVGHLDEDGFLYLTDRKAYMIITGGVNVYPQEVENVLAVHPKVADVAVFGVPNDDFGEEVKAVVQPRRLGRGRPGARAGADRLLPAAPRRVKCPRSVDFRPELPAAPDRQAVQAAAQGRVLGGRREGDLRDDGARQRRLPVLALARTPCLRAPRRGERGAREHDAGLRARRGARVPVPRDRRPRHRRRCAGRSTTTASTASRTAPG